VTTIVADALPVTSTGEAVAFWILGTVAVVGAIGTVAAARAVYSAMFLGMTMITLAAFYAALDAAFLGVVQVVVYTGAVMMLFLFVLMLIGVDLSESLRETIRGQRSASILAAIGFAVLLIAGIGRTTRTEVVGLRAPTGDGNVAGLAALVFTRYIWAFELTGALMITAALAAMVLAHRERFERRKTQRELAVERFRPGGRPTPLPSPGVYARHNAVDLPARLPDGSGAPDSVAGGLLPRRVPPPQVQAGSPLRLRLVTVVSADEPVWVERWADGETRNGHSLPGSAPEGTER